MISALRTAIRSAIPRSVSAWLHRIKHPQIELDPNLGLDDYDWRYYHLDYRAQIAEIEKTLLLRLLPGNFSVSNGQISTSVPLHPNHQCLYETMLSLFPESIVEIGCGGGDHLHNLGTLMPHVQLHGFDRSRKQIDFLKARSPHLSRLVKVLDITEKSLPFQADAIYTQAVLMHIQSPGAHTRALRNIFAASKRYVVLMENWHRHHFMNDIINLGLGVHLYFRRQEGKPHLLVASRVPLPFEKLKDYRQLTHKLT